MQATDTSTRTDTSNRERQSTALTSRSALRRGALGGGAIAAAIAMFVHPHAGDHPYEGIASAADTWLLTHIVLFASFLAIGVGTFLLARRLGGRLASIGQVGAAIFTVFYGGYVAMVGLSTALIVRAGSGLSGAEQAGINEALVYLLETPAIMAVAGVGTLGFLIAVGAIAVGYRRLGVSVVPLVLLFGAVVALGIHSGLIAVVGMLAFLAGVAWIEVSTSAQTDESPA